MTKHHINPATGNTGVCNAKKRCPHGGDESHFSSPELARAVYETREELINGHEAEAAYEYKNSKPMTPGDYDSFVANAEHIADWPEPWTQVERENYELLRSIQKITRSGNLTPELVAQASELHDKLHPHADIPYKSGSDSWKRRDKAITGLARAELALAELRVKNYGPLEKTPSNEGLIGLEEARAKVVADSDRFHPGIDMTPAGVDRIVDRMVSGHRLETSVALEHESEVPPKDRGLWLFDPKKPQGSNSLYMASVWPQNELRQAMEQSGITGVATSPLINGRETGIIYTVIDPEGNTRSFAVYEHRNSDSIIINGKTNREADERPYVADTANAYFAEFAPADTKTAASTLAFFLKEAQKGELPSDEELAASVSKRDWVSILSESVPGFASWHAERTGPRDPHQDDAFERLRMEMGG